MANVDLTISAMSSTDWVAILPRLTFYAEEADIRFDTGEYLLDSKGRVYGACVRVAASTASRLLEILAKAGITSLTLHIEPILPQLDPEEKKIQEKLYPGGDTSNKPPELKDRELPSSHLSYSMSWEDYCAWQKGQGRRSRS